MLTEASFEGIGICEDAIIVESNDQLADMLGYTRAELIGKPVTDLIAPASRDFVLEMTKDCHAEPYEHLALRKNGSIFPVEVCARTMSGSGRHLRVTTVRDITLRKQSEDQLRILTERLKLATAAAAIAVWDWDLRSDFIQCDERIFEMYGLPHDPNGTLAYSKWKQCVHPEDLPGQIAAFKKTIAEKGRQVRDFRIVLPDGSIRHIHAADAVIADEQGTPIRIVGLNIDVTEQKRAEESLRESEKRFRSYFELPIIGLVVTSLEKGFLEVNDELCKILGYSREELMAKRWSELTHPDDLAADVFQFRSVLAGELEGYSMEKRFLRKDGEFIQARMSVRGVRRPNGAVDYFIGMIQDITASKRAEAERAESVRREQRALEDYTRRLIASQEAERRRIAGELHDSLGQNLLLIKNRVQQALRSGANDWREQLEAASRLASEAIAEVRHISHDLRPYQLDQLGLTRALEALIDGAAESTKTVFERKLDNVDEVFAPEAATNLYRIVQECLTNILRHAQAQKVRIELERDIHNVRLWVVDDGCGFAPNPEGELPSGGLGLRNISERVRILGGALKIHSEPGKGTSVEILLPIKS